MDPLAFLNNIPPGLQPYIPPLVAVIVVVMGLALIVSFNNPGLRAAVKEHVVWLIVGIAMAVGGSAIILNFVRTAGLKV
jgi:hypothetical protein